MCLGLLDKGEGGRMGWFGRALGLAAVELLRLGFEEMECVGWLMAAREESWGRPVWVVPLVVGWAAGWGDSSEDWQQPCMTGQL